MLEVQGDIKCELGDRIQLGNEKFSKPDDEGSKSSDNNLSFDLNIESDECIELTEYIEQDGKSTKFEVCKIRNLGIQ